MGYKNFISYKEAQLVAQKHQIKTLAGWNKFAKSKLRPSNVPANPYRTYQKEWISWKHFLGTVFISYEEAKKYARKNKIKTVKAWNCYTKSPENSLLPKDPLGYYTKSGEWVSWKDFFGISKYCSSRGFYYFSYDEARQYLDSFNVKSLKDLKLFLKQETIDHRFPKRPYKYYKRRGDWIDYYHLFSSEENRKRNPDIIMFSYKEAQQYVSSLGIKLYTELCSLIKQGKADQRFPINFCTYYKRRGKWTGWHDFIKAPENYYRGRVFFSYKEAREHLSSFNLSSAKELGALLKTNKLDLRFPKCPYSYYKKRGTWVSYYHFLKKQKKNTKS